MVRYLLIHRGVPTPFMTKHDLDMGAFIKGDYLYKAEYNNWYRCTKSSTDTAWADFVPTSEVSVGRHSLLKARLLVEINALIT
jgi:hypothetical protein